MNNSITIVPVDDEMAIMANSIKILNQYKGLGFNKREAFVQLIMDEDASYKDLAGMQKLNNFWAMRVKDVNLNNDLQRILETIKRS